MNNGQFNLNQNQNQNQNDNNNSLEFLPQVNNFQLPTELTKPFEDETDSDMALDSDDDNGDIQDTDQYDSDDDNSDSDDIQDIECNNTTTTSTNNNNGGQNKNSKSSSSTNTTTAEKKTPNAFILFAMERRKQLKRDYPDLPMATISQMLGKEWKELHPNDKRVFTEKAASMRENKNSK